ncbi:hypothetical protein OO015_04895 [Thermomicrobium sp. 4228-Ro]|uniref:hypothetical protein n=1 Tax=Thermomicrobium sp. 4228-Ro TaxID=2993937 RepID=UPI0022492A4E|nr:hypothetical protein [Thermomicrobium sp. 4228-Ro]MCX2726831.1 hypothetical protein [Thermomicrobium sp. 4228-Ro]
MTVTQGATTFQSLEDYFWFQTGSILTISWAPAGPLADEPGPASTYTVSVTCGNAVHPRIGGVVKEASPADLHDAVWTSKAHESVTGYTSLPASDVVLLPAWSWSFPIVQTNNGWNTVLFITNFNPGPGNCSVNVDLYAATEGSSHGSDGHFSKLLGVGETWQIDLVHEYNWPTGWVGTAFVTADCPIGATAERLKPTQPWGTPVNMAITNVAQPTVGNWFEVYAPLVYQAYNGWNTGISVANLDPSANNEVDITFYNKDGSIVFADSLSIEPRGMEYIYLPANTDIGTNSLAQAVIRSTNGRNLAAAVDYVKYTGADRDVGQASGYLAQQGTFAQVNGPEDIPGTLSVALFQKQHGLTQQNDNSGIAIFNANRNSGARVEAWFYDGAGFLVAPTLSTPIVIDLQPKGGAILYAPWYSEMPNGFRGSVLMQVVQGGPVACVSNNVNYDVQYDGSATYNCFLTPPIDVPAPTYNLAVDPMSAVNVCEPVRDQNGNLTFDCPDHTITATLTFGGEPVEGTNILFEILDGSLHDGADVDGGPADLTFQLSGDDDAIEATDADGQAQFIIEGTDTGTDTHHDDVLVCADLNDNGVCDKATEPYAVVSKDWVGLTLAQTFPANNGNAPETGVGNTIRDWTVAVNRTVSAASVPVVLVLNEATPNPVDASFAPCNQPDQNSTDATVNAASTPFDVYACDYNDDGTDDTVVVELYWDQNGNGVHDAGEPLIDSLTLTLSES